MISENNYANAYKEVYVILNNMEEKEVKKIPKSFIEMIKKNMNREYQFELEEDFGKQKILQETKVVLAYIFLNYWNTKEQKIRIEKKFKQDRINEEIKKLNK